MSMTEALTHNVPAPRDLPRILVAYTSFLDSNDECRAYGRALMLALASAAGDPERERLPSSLRDPYRPTAIHLPPTSFRLLQERAERYINLHVFVAFVMALMHGGTQEAVVFRRMEQTFPVLVAMAVRGNVSVEGLEDVEERYESEESSTDTIMREFTQEWLAQELQQFESWALDSNDHSYNRLTFLLYHRRLQRYIDSLKPMGQPFLEVPDWPPIPEHLERLTIPSPSEVSFFTSMTSGLAVSTAMPASLDAAVEAFTLGPDPPAPTSSSTSSSLLETSSGPTSSTPTPYISPSAAPSTSTTPVPSSSDHIAPTPSEPPTESRSKRARERTAGDQGRFQAAWRKGDKARHGEGEREEEGSADGDAGSEMDWAGEEAVGVGEGSSSGADGEPAAAGEGIGAGAGGHGEQQQRAESGAAEGRSDVLRHLHQEWQAAQDKHTSTGSGIPSSLRNVWIAVHILSEGPERVVLGLILARSFLTEMTDLVEEQLEAAEGVLVPVISASLFAPTTRTAPLPSIYQPQADDSRFRAERRLDRRTIRSDLLQSSTDVTSRARKWLNTHQDILGGVHEVLENEEIPGGGETGEDPPSPVATEDGEATGQAQDSLVIGYEEGKGTEEKASEEIRKEEPFDVENAIHTHARMRVMRMLIFELGSLRFLPKPGAP